MEWSLTSRPWVSLSSSYIHCLSLDFELTFQLIIGLPTNKKATRRRTGTQEATTTNKANTIALGTILLNPYTPDLIVRATLVAEIEEISQIKLSIDGFPALIRSRITLGHRKTAREDTSVTCSGQHQGPEVEVGKIICTQIRGMGHRLLIDHTFTMILSPLEKAKLRITLGPPTETFMMTELSMKMNL